MPMPKPEKREEKNDFVSRCIGELTREESERFPTREQRAAICYTRWGETPEEREAAMAKKPKRSRKDH